MILDEAWLGQLRFPLGDGYALEGIFVGGSGVVCKVINPDGSEHALKSLSRDLFAFPSWVREVPNWMAAEPIYDVGRLNRKLANLVGDPRLHQVVRSFRLIATSMLAGLYEEDITDLATISVEPPEFQRYFRWFLLSPGFRGLLDEARLAPDAEPRRKAWATQVASGLARLAPGGDDLAPERSVDNPLLVWAGAVSEGYFTMATLSAAGAAARTRLDALPDATADLYVGQLEAMLWGLAQVDALGARMRVFCDELDLFDEELAADDDRSTPDEFGRLLAAVRA